MVKRTLREQRDAIVERRIRVVLEAITAAPPQLEMLEALARPEAREATLRLRAIVELPNVVGVGIAEKVTGGVGTGDLALAVYVENKREPRSRAERVPPELPHTLGTPGVPTDVVELGKVVPEAKVQRTPIEPGFSVGHSATTAGTLGAIVGPASAPQILSANHILAQGGRAQIGDAILFPGSADGGSGPGDLVARLIQVVPFTVGGEFVNQMDAAVARVESGRRAELRSRISELGIVPRRTTLPRRGMAVTKVGRTTGLTRGVVRDVNFRFGLRYDGVGEVGFLDQVLCTRYTAGGDSGSLVLEEATGLAVGLHFAGANGGSVFSPIRPVLRMVRARFTQSLGE